MDNDFQNVILEGLTEALNKNAEVMIKSNNKGMMTIAATNNEIVTSISKMQFLTNDIVNIISDALDARPDMVYDRKSLAGDFKVYYTVWLRNNSNSTKFIKKEFSLPQNNITFLSEKVLSVIQNMS